MTPHGHCPTAHRSTAAEYRTLIARLGLSQVGAGRLIGVDPRTSRHYAAGTREVPEPTMRLLRYLDRASVTPEEFEAVLGRVAVEA